MVVLFGLAVVGDHPGYCCEVIVVGDDGAAVAVASEIFGGEKGCASEVSHGTCFSGGTVGEGIVGADGLCVVFDDEEVVLLGQGEDGFHIGALSEQVHGYDGFGSRGDMGFDEFCGDVEGMWIHVGHDGDEAQESDDFRGCDVGECGYDDFVAGFEAECHHGDLEGVGTVGAGDDVGGAEVLFEVFAESLHFGASNEGSGIEHLVYFPLHGILNVQVLGFEVNHLYHRMGNFKRLRRS